MKSQLKGITIVLISLMLPCFAEIVLLKVGEGKLTGTLGLILIWISMTMLTAPAALMFMKYFGKYLFRISPGEEEEIESILKDIQTVNNSIYKNPYKS